MHSEEKKDLHDNRKPIAKESDYDPTTKDRLGEVHLSRTSEPN